MLAVSLWRNGLSFIGLLALSFIVTSASAQVDGAKQRQDSIALVRSEMRLNGDTSNLGQLPVYMISNDSAKIAARNDSIEKKHYKKHSPKRAVWMSAVCPGLGQVYNKKYWKVPIIYGGFAGLGYAVYYTASNYINARNAYRAQVDEDPNTNGSFQGITNAATLKEYRDYHKKNLTIASLCTVLWYCLNLVDAAVDGHLFEYNMSDKLSMRWEPSIGPSYAYNSNYAFNTGIRVNLHF